MSERRQASRSIQVIFGISLRPSVLASYADVRRVLDAVAERFEIQLSPEVNVVGEAGEPA